MPLYEVAIIERPTKKQAEEGATEKLLMEPTPVIARDPQSAGIAAALKAKLDVDMERAEVLVRPFV